MLMSRKICFTFRSTCSLPFPRGNNGLIVLFFFLKNLFHLVNVVCTQTGLTDIGLICDEWIDADTGYCRIPQKNYLSAAKKLMKPTPDWAVFSFTKLHSIGK